MNSITGNPKKEISTPSKTTNNQKDVETTGSIASITPDSIFMMPVANYDMFIPTNPFSLNIDFGNYADEANQTLASNSSFMQGWASAMAALSPEGGFGGGFGGAGGECVASGASSVGSCSVGGGFTSVG